MVQRESHELCPAGRVGLERRRRRRQRLDLPAQRLDHQRASNRAATGA